MLLQSPIVRAKTSHYTSQFWQCYYNSLFKVRRSFQRSLRAITIVYSLRCYGKHCFHGNRENLNNSFIWSRTKLIFGKNVPWQNSCCQRDPYAKYELCQTWDERVIKFFLCCYGEDVYHSNGHRNGVINTWLFSHLIFVANINFVQLQMNELLRLFPVAMETMFTIAMM